MSTLEQHLDENRRYHCIDSHALVTDGGEYWMIHGKLHRVTGPAKILKSKLGNRGDYYLDGLRYTKKGYTAKILLMKL